jgi:hypothetical protein
VALETVSYDQTILARNFEFPEDVSAGIQGVPLPSFYPAGLTGAYGIRRTAGPIEETVFVDNDELLGCGSAKLPIEHNAALAVGERRLRHTAPSQRGIVEQAQGNQSLQRVVFGRGIPSKRKDTLLVQVGFDTNFEPRFVAGQYAVRKAASADAQDLRNVRDAFGAELVDLLRQEPIEDGVFHRGEDLLEATFEEYPRSSLRWVQDLFHSNEASPAIAGGLLRLLGRLPLSQVEPIGTLLALVGLRHPDTEVRESAVRALEAWGGPRARHALQDHLASESSRLLTKYIEQVILDLAPCQ